MEISKKHKEYNETHREQNAIQKREYTKLNREKIREKNKKYSQLDKVKERKKYTIAQRKSNDYIFRLKLQIRNFVLKSFKRKRYSKNFKGEIIIGMNIDDFCNYLLDTFKNNYGYEWDKNEPVHIDHIVSLATAKTEEDVIKLCHYTNLQLLKAKDNLEKSNKLDWKLKNNE